MFHLVNFGKVSVQRVHTIAVIGSGPSGYYTCQKLMKSDLVGRVDLYEKLPLPYGLVRYGVAPDHPEVKKVVHSFERVASHPKFQFYGNCPISNNGRLSLNYLSSKYSKVVLAVGCSLPNQTLTQTMAGTAPLLTGKQVVDWYNGVPDTVPIQLNGVNRMVVVGHGNVSLDIVRLLFTAPQRLKRFDLPQPVLQELTQFNQVQEILLVGRRGPLQVQFTTKELKEILSLQDVVVQFDKPFLMQEVQRYAHQVQTNRPLKRLLDTLLQYQPNLKAKKVCKLLFCTSPLGWNGLNPAGQLVCRKNRLVLGCDGTVQAKGTSERFHLETDLVIEAIGYRPDNPFQLELKGNAIHNRDGTVLDKEGNQVPNLFVVGWAQTGGKGVLLSTLHSATVTTRSLLNQLELEKKRGRGDSSTDKPGVSLAELKQMGLQPTTFSQWKKLDTYEISQGNQLHKSREKVLQVSTMLQVMTDED